MRYAKHTGIIINRLSVGDTDRFFTIFTPDQGKLSVYGAGVRSSRSRRGASLDLFNRIKFEVSERGGRRALTHVELVESYRLGKKKLVDISRLFVLGELIDALLPEEDPHLEVYELLDTALTHLSRHDTPEYLTRFKLKLLKLLGYGSPPSGIELNAYIESIIDKSLRTGHIL
jgi:DNA repair protein RecO